MKTIYDIINLKKQYSNLEDDATFMRLVAWYKYTIDEGLILTEYKGDKLQGFIEWIRLERVPDDINDIKPNYDCIHTAPVLFVINAVAKNMATYKRLIKEVKNRNKDREYSAFYRSKDGRMRVIKDGGKNG